ncbi:rifin [Plasmodium reichenowi]|uniref:Rifin n=1 Tax=Plasmodium reichenowi TaxID=5854 RepID=A0A060RMK2_PLARE|nr:rifin [Plasmodium reichenowi]
MIVHYINILFFSLPLNILVNTHKKKSSITHHIPISRLLCECELYAPANYDNDQEMKSVMETFNKQTQQRFHEYDNRMKNTRQKCKERCDEEIQKIILKDRLEKELMDKFATLQTDIQSDAIRTCICEKSLADKTEKFCLNCGKNIGAIAPWWGLVCGVGYSGWLNTAMEAAAQKGIDAGMATAIKILKVNFGLGNLTSSQWTKLISAETFKNQPLLASNLKEISDEICVMVDGTYDGDAICLFKQFGDLRLSKAIATHTKTATADAAAEAASVESAEINLINAAGSTYYTVITASVVAIVVIVFVMFIIYLILRYRRKKKMKKKLQYIKLLE